MIFSNALNALDKFSVISDAIRELTCDFLTAISADKPWRKTPEIIALNGV